MITMSKLGKNGRLGNQIFQYAFLFGLSKLKNYSFCIPPDTDLEKCFDLNCKIQNINLIRRKKEPHFHFDTNFPNVYQDNCDYFGYFQCETYFEKNKNELKQSLQFKEKHKKELPEKDLVSIHIRRGDYVGSNYHPVVSLDYINKAKTYFKDKKFIIFSDDIEWCKNNKLADYYSENNSHYTDLYLMSLCTGSIIANSSFSWWGAYLGNIKEKIIAPQKWFIKKDINSSNVYCKEWIKI